VHPQHPDVAPRCDGRVHPWWPDAKADTHPASTYELDLELLSTGHLSKVQDGENECPAARTLDVEWSGLATTKPSVVNGVEAADDAPVLVNADQVQMQSPGSHQGRIMYEDETADHTPLLVNLDEDSATDSETVTMQAAPDAGGFSPKLIEDQVSASVFHEAFVNWSPEAGTATPRSEEHTSGSAASSDQQARTIVDL